MGYSGDYLRDSVRAAGARASEAVEADRLANGEARRRAIVAAGARASEEVEATRRFREGTERRQPLPAADPYRSASEHLSDAQLYTSIASTALSALSLLGGGWRR